MDILREQNVYLPLKGLVVHTCPVSTSLSFGAETKQSLRWFYRGTQRTVGCELVRIQVKRGNLSIPHQSPRYLPPGISCTCLLSGASTTGAMV